MELSVCRIFPAGLASISGWGGIYIDAIFVFSPWHSSSGAWLCSFGLSKTLVMQPPLPRSEQDGSGYQTIEEHEERAETEAADAPHSGDKTKQDDGGMPHILGKPAYRNGHNCSNEDQCIENGKEIVTYATHHTQKITQGNKEKRAPCCLQCPLACGSEGWHTPPQAESKRKQRQDDKGNAVLPATLFGTERFHSSGHRLGNATFVSVARHRPNKFVLCARLAKRYVF